MENQDLNKLPIETAKEDVTNTERWLQTRALRAEEYYLFAIMSCYNGPRPLEVIMEDYKKEIHQTKRDLKKLMEKGYVKASTKVMTKALFSITEEMK